MPYIVSLGNDCANPKLTRPKINLSMCLQPVQHANKLIAEQEDKCFTHDIDIYVTFNTQSTTKFISGSIKLFANTSKIMVHCV